MVDVLSGIASRLSSFGEGPSQRRKRNGSRQQNKEQQASTSSLRSSAPGRKWSPRLSPRCPESPRDLRLLDASYNDSSSDDGSKSASSGTASIVSVEFTNGDRYWGPMEDDETMVGYGTYLHADGREYKGNFRGDLKVGLGVMKYPSGDKYIGEFENDEPHGRGTIVYADDGGRFVGRFYRGKRNGTGTIYYSNGQWFQGEFRDDQKIRGSWFDQEGKITRTVSSRAEAMRRIRSSSRDSGSVLTYRFNGQRNLGPLISSTCSGTD
mmetsp:Transcript_45837/g.112399  ORF Transcript_45837/g.112399 Transcript_45837/m.112399 type:complete len:266 (-) Transcript_45837:111-908(-)|eukprot:CAMPEP_0198334234 /NCGR_PEP_ID=MMETSP1450-20131203/19483_1 /TAXON_ID=753684 ORGANISM="Madagascaria erythrocladiodes, Strain CCMP3234" /NCGR_SAMPLE_ID=MMETSP1450 /ASSEMBLY_ACC=CAM_ASM_001115 /LENGTH=265 /DNA_ID=CAMNT_0044038811 /DNA_START=467 /DNA_END=1264 /DNA_ORIENTATION=+